MIKACLARLLRGQRSCVFFENWRPEAYKAATVDEEGIIDVANILNWKQKMTTSINPYKSAFNEFFFFFVFA